ncbi:MAG: P1 family peptidase [Theionarchaea archaeon]|nr:MAG: aminopeptidase [Theionarchaea archaeon DG-70-1]MBU7026467.1 P1 family peptidase [Theionarchaea archaeon]
MKTPLDITIGSLEHGKRNAISDVKGVIVGHCTLIEGEGELIVGKGPVRTGVTAILPHEGNIYKEKLLAAAHVANGYSKPIGLIQVEELGVIETPIVLTNTLSVGVAADAVIHYMLDNNEDIGVTTGSVNPIVMECNDSYLNDIRGGHVKKEHIFNAISAASNNFKEGAVGAGTGMSAFEFKGGIGSSSRVVDILDKKITVGALVLTNFGKREDLIVAGVPVGKELKDWPGKGGNNKGSIIMVLATDAFLTARQLKRVARRAVVGLARTGGYASHGSGDIILAFSTAQRIPHYTEGLLTMKAFPDNTLSLLFKATAEAVEEAVIASLIHAEPMEGRNKRIRYSLPHDELMQIMTEYGHIK